MSLHRTHLQQERDIRYVVGIRAQYHFLDITKTDTLKHQRSNTGTLISLFLLFLFFLLYGGAICLVMGDPATFYYYVPMHLMGQPIYWISVLGTVGIAASFDIIAEYLRLEFAPNLSICVLRSKEQNVPRRRKTGHQKYHVKTNPNVRNVLGIQKPVSKSSSSSKRRTKIRKREIKVHLTTRKIPDIE